MFYYQALEMGRSAIAEAMHGVVSMDAIRTKKAKRKHTEEETRSRKRRNAGKGIEEGAADQDDVVYERGAF